MRRRNVVTAVVFLIAQVSQMPFCIFHTQKDLRPIPFLVKPSIQIAIRMTDASPDTAQLRDLKVQCSRSGLAVRVRFSEPFYGIIYSADHYGVAGCTYVSQADGRTSFRYDSADCFCSFISFKFKSGKFKRDRRYLYIQTTKGAPVSDILPSYNGLNGKGEREKEKIYNTKFNQAKRFQSVGNPPDYLAGGPVRPSAGHHNKI